MYTTGRGKIYNKYKGLNMGFDQNKKFCDIDFYKSLAVKEIFGEDDVTSQYEKIPDPQERARLMDAHALRSEANPTEPFYLVTDPKWKKDRFAAQICNDPLRLKKVKNTNTKRILKRHPDSDKLITSLPIGYVQ